MKQIAVYTCIIGQYDTLSSPVIFNDLVDYICFVKKGEGHKYNNNNNWIIKELDIDCDDNILLSRFPKLNPHIVLPEYNYSLWIDGNITIAHSDLYNILTDKINNGVVYSGIKHWGRNCIYDEAKAIAYTGKETVINLIRTLNFLYKHNFPTHFGLAENNIIFRKHNDPNIINVDIEWWNLFCSLCKRDQMTFGYCLFKHGVEWDFILPNGENARTHHLFKIYNHCNVASYSFLKKMGKRLSGVIRKEIISVIEILLKIKYIKI